MLEGVEAEIGLAGGVRMAVDGDYTAFFAELGVVEILLRGECLRRRSFDSSAAADSLRMTGIFESILASHPFARKKAKGWGTQLPTLSPERRRKDGALRD
jgi:hypothetical protein